MSDLVLARTDTPGSFNLAIGEPVVVQDAFAAAFTGESTWSATKPPWPVRYPALGGEKELVEELGMLYPNKNIVITNGAKQALVAAFLAFKKLSGKVGVSHDQPYWLSYPTLSAHAGLQFKKNDSYRYIQCITAPNNPDGDQVEWGSDGTYDIWDAVYAHRMYGWNGQTPKVSVIVDGASKMLGVTGYRVGWLVANDPAIASFASKYVEESTSGVATSSQYQVLHLLRLRRTHHDLFEGAVDKARQDMLTNGKTFIDLVGPYCELVQGVPYNGSGMFSWFKVKGGVQGAASFERALQHAKVMAVPGNAFGVKEPGWFRMNMAHRCEYTERALTSLRNKLHA